MTLPAQARLRGWHDLIRQNPADDGIVILSAVNRWWNDAVAYHPEPRGEDKWQTPEQTLTLGTGDCEDYAIGKMATLLRCGVPPDELRLLCCRLAGWPHMVLGYYNGWHPQPLILDNLHSRVRPLNERRDLTLIYGVNAQGAWVGNALTQARHAAFDELMKGA